MENKNKSIIKNLFLQRVEQTLFNLNAKNFEKSMHETMDEIDPNYFYSYNLIVCRLIYSCIISKINDFNMYFDFFKKTAECEKENYQNLPNITDIFSKYILCLTSKESNYILEKMIEQGLIESNSVKSKRTIYFAHYKTKEEIYDLDEYFPSFYENYKELSNNDWELHKKFVKEGVNPNEIAKIIRNDEIEKLQEISSQNDFNFDQFIEPSLYERYSFINQENVTLIDYAAFFGSVKCFKYLLMNGANVNNTGKYAIAGGNEEIIHLCEQNHSTFEDPYETAIKFHRNDIFKYIYENKFVKINDLSELGVKCVSENNYEIFSFLEEEGMKINSDIIKESAKIGNTFMLKLFIKKFDQTPHDILVNAIQSQNIETIKLILEQKSIDINAKDINLFNLISILII